MHLKFASLPCAALILVAGSVLAAPQTITTNPQWGSSLGSCCFASPSATATATVAAQLKELQRAFPNPGVSKEVKLVSLKATANPALWKMTAHSKTVALNSNIVNQWDWTSDINAVCPVGAGKLNSAAKCVRVESPAECVAREIAPYKKAYDDGIQWCKNLYNNDVGKMNITMRKWRQDGGTTVGAAVGLTSVVFATVGAVTTTFGVVAANSINGLLIGSDLVLGKKLFDHWAAYMNAAEAQWNNKLLNQENQCFATFEKTYLARKASVKKLCGA